MGEDAYVAAAFEPMFFLRAAFSHQSSLLSINPVGAGPVGVLNHHVRAPGHHGRF